MEFPIDLKRYLACRKQCYNIGEFVNHVKVPNQDKLIVSSFSKYVNIPKKVIDFIEYNKNIVAEAVLGMNNNPDPTAIIMAEMMIYNLLTTKQMNVLHELY